MDDNMTVLELVKEYFPNATEKECEYILWEKTAFPMGSVNIIRKQLQEHKNTQTVK